MIVQAHNIFSILTSLKQKTELGLDTETTGLLPYHGDELFSLIIADENDAYYFDFNSGGWQPNLEQIQELLNLPVRWYMANAKFDLAMLERFGLWVAGEVHDLQTHERVLDSTLFGKVFALEAIAERYQEKKDDKVKEWVEANRAYTKVVVPGKKKRDKRLHFDRVPLEIIAPYAEQDGLITFRIGRKQRERFKASEIDNIRSLSQLWENETKLTRTVYDMERAGVKVDLRYCKEAAAFEANRREGLIKKFEEMAGVPFVDSAKTFTPLFEKADVVLKKTAKGKPSFKAEALATYKHPLVDVITGIRDAKSRSDYFHGFLYHVAPDGRIHASFNQYQAVTGRFSSSNPNLQNLTRPDEDAAAELYPVRRAFVPPPGFFLAMFDYDQMEYRLMLEYAGCRALIDKVLGGLDVHAATAELAGITRQQAKTTNFLTIYGGGDAVLAAKLGVSTRNAAQIRDAIFAAAPEIKIFMRACMARAEGRGFVSNWFGRRQYFPDPRTSYRAPNHLIQGGCADVVKIAMNRVADRLRGMKSRLVLSVHDELVIETHESEVAMLPDIREIMEAVYPSRWLKLTAGASHSFKNLGEKIKGYPA